MVASLVAASSRNNYVFAKISELTTGNEKTSHLDPTKNYFVPFRSSSLFRNSNAQWGGGGGKKSSVLKGIERIDRALVNETFNLRFDYRTAYTFSTRV